MQIAQMWWGMFKKRGKLASQFEATALLRIRALMIEMFTWGNLPEGLTSKKIELFLFDHGSVGFAPIAGKGKTGRYLVAPFASSQDIDLYGDFQSVSLFSPNGKGIFKKLYSVGSNVELIYNTTDRTSSLVYLAPYLEALKEIYISKFINLKNSRQKAIMTGTKDTMKKARRQYYSAVESDDNLVFLANGQKMKIEKFDLDIKYEPELFWKDYHETWNEMLNSIGIANNSAVGKKERLVVDEVDRDSEQTILFRETMLQERKRAVDKINKTFGLSITVEYNTEAMTQINRQTPKKEGE